MGILDFSINATRQSSSPLASLMYRDTALKTIVSVLDDLASAPTICQLEQHADEASARAMKEVLIDQLIHSFQRPPKELVQYFDANNDPVHGERSVAFSISVTMSIDS